MDKMRALGSMMLLAALACVSPEPAPAAALALTHQWSTKPGTSLFAQVSLGASPEGVADSLMGIMPTLVHQLGDRCREVPAPVGAGAFSLSFGLDEGVAAPVTADPRSPIGDCAAAALPALVLERAKDLAGVPAAKVVVYLEHAPMG